MQILMAAQPRAQTHFHSRASSYASTTELTDQLSDCLTSIEQTIVLVVEETGWGVVPPTAIGGLFRDRLGQLGQRLNAQADESWLVVQSMVPTHG